MEHAPDTPLHHRWPTMDIDNQVKCISAIYKNLKEVADLQFSVYGSLYFANFLNPGASKLSLSKEFYIGPHCGAAYWNCNSLQPRYYHNIDPNQGPWPSLDAYCDGLIDAGISRIPPADAVQNRPRYHGSIQAHHDLLRHGRMVLKKMAEDSRIQKASIPTLFHPDLHKRNSFVSEEDPTLITAIIDWQSSSIEPAFWYTDEVPNFAQPVADLSQGDQIEPKSEACAKINDISTQFLIPKLSRPRLMGETLFRPFRYCHRTWKDGVVTFHEELIQVAQHWKELNLPDICPFILPSPGELNIHQKDFKLFEASHQLRDGLSSLLDTASDSWVPSEAWETTKSAHRETFKGLLRQIMENESPDNDEPIRNEADLREICPFDLED